jgi:hypothetical protein
MKMATPTGWRLQPTKKLGAALTEQITVQIRRRRGRPGPVVVGGDIERENGEWIG